MSFSFLAGESAVVLTSVFEQLQALNERVHTFAFDIVFIQIRQQLAQTPKLQVQFCFFGNRPSSSYDWVKLLKDIGGI